MHYFQPYFSGLEGKALSIGGTGVHVFFFCSGFGLFMSYTKRKLGYLEFLKKRFLKIYIPYIVIVAVWLLLPLPLETDPLKTFLAHAFLYKMFMPLYEGTPTAAFWYMSTLFQFYFLFIPLARMKERIGTRKFLSISCTLSVAWWIFTTMAGVNDERVWWGFFLQYLWEFAIGMVIAERLIQGKDIKIKNSVLVLFFLAAILVAGVLKIIGGLFDTLNGAFTVCAYGSIALLIYSLGFINTVICWISSISFEWYLLHMLVISILGFVFNSNMVLSLIAIPISLLIAWIYKMLEVCFGNYTNSRK